MACRAFRLFLHVVATVLEAISRRAKVCLVIVVLLKGFCTSLIVFIGITPTTFLHRRQVFFRFGTPALVIHRVRIGLICLMRERAICRLFRVVGHGRITSCVSVGSTPVVFKDVFCVSRQGVFDASKDRRVYLFRHLSRYLSSPRGSNFH